MLFHLIIIPKYNGKAISVIETSEQEFSDDDIATNFYEEYFKDLSLPFEQNKVFDITIFEGTREVKNYKLDKPFPIEPTPTLEIEMAYA